MNRSEALLLLQALRTGDKKAISEFMRVRALEHRIVCEHCRERVLPLVRVFDFDEMVVSVECSLCGKLNRIPLKSWTGVDPLQPPPRS
ncbi:MAG: hypothetical protein ACLQU1_25660 [Bryobacteraceae bacterium]